MNVKVRNIHPEYHHQWRKLHIGIDAQILQIWAIDLTTNNVSDSQALDDLISQIPILQDEHIGSVFTDGAYEIKHCRQMILDRYGYVLILFRKIQSLRKIKRLIHFREMNGFVAQTYPLKISSAI